MTTNCNGVNNNTRIEYICKNDSEEGKSDHCFEKQDFSVNVGFRGFEKVPTVVLHREDIKPYLKSVKRKIPPDSIHLERLSQECEVKLIKDDLFNLQQLTGRPNSARASLSESETDTAELSNLKCKICEKGYDSIKKLQNHQQNKHMIVYQPQSKIQKRVSFSDHVIVHEVKEYHKCRKCTKIFEDYQALKVHMRQKHKKRKCYICYYCEKNFVDRMFFKVHIKLHCDVCKLLLPSKSKYLEHRRNVCRVLKLYKCKTCNEAYFKLMDLKDHSYDHLSTFFICDICKDQLGTKCAVAHHISFLHSEKRPTSLYEMRNIGSERVYLCNFCETSFVDHDMIENHVQSLPDLANKAMTGYKDYYFCDQCLRKFSTEKDMLQHKWSHFLKRSDNSQTRQNGNEVKPNIKTHYSANDVIPEHMKPKVVLEKIKVGGKVVTEPVDYIDVKNFDVIKGDIKKAIVNPKSKKTIISKYQCQKCFKYYSNSYCLSRHIQTQHEKYLDLRCPVCEETFVWPSLLRSHNCIRLNLPEMPFDDARPEIHFDNLHEVNNGFDNFNIDDDDYVNSVDFEIPAPIVELIEYENGFPTPNKETTQVFNQVGDKSVDTSMGYKVIMQEVPIEF